MIPYRVEPINTILAELQAPVKSDSGVSFEEHLQSGSPPSSADEPPPVVYYDDPPVGQIELANPPEGEPEESVEETAQDDASDSASEDSPDGESQVVEASKSAPEETSATAVTIAAEEPAPPQKSIDIDAESVALQDADTAQERGNKPAPAKAVTAEQPPPEQATQQHRLPEEEVAAAANASKVSDENRVEIESPKLTKRTGQQQQASQRGTAAEDESDSNVVKKPEGKPTPPVSVNATSDAAKLQPQEEEKTARRSGNRFASPIEPTDSPKANRVSAARRAAAAAVAVAASNDTDSAETPPATTDQTTATTSSETALRAPGSNAIGALQSRLSGTSGAQAHKTSQETKPLTEPQQAQLVQRVARAFEVAHHRGESTIRLRLSPPELGSLRLEIKLEGGAMMAHVEAETATARDVLMDNLHTLRQRLAEQNIKVENFDVSLQDRQSGGQTEHNGGHRSGQQSSRQQNESSADRPDAEHRVGEDVSPATSSDNGALDVTI